MLADMTYVESSQHRVSERRRKGTGQVDTKPCPHCAASVWIDPRRVGTDGDTAATICLSCGGSIPVRHADKHRPVPADAPPIVSPSRWQRLLNRV
jgi:hypothetical protein